MENINLIEILKDAPRGTKLYSVMYGDCFLDQIKGEESNHPIVIRRPDDTTIAYTKEGRWLYNYPGECLIFPSRENKDWSTFKVEEFFKVGDHVMNKKSGGVYVLTEKTKSVFKIVAIRSHTVCGYFSLCENDLKEEYKKVEKFDPQWLKPYDWILARDGKKATWFATQFSHLREDKIYPYVINNNCAYENCIPYNEETKHLRGTNVEEPDFYKI